jgi:hypothetical protein
MVTENLKRVTRNQTLLKKKERVTSMNTELTADQRIFKGLSRY